MKLELTAQDDLQLQTVRIVASIETQSLTQLQDDDGDGDAPLIGIVGDRGSGKTTLLRHLSGHLSEHDQFIVLPILRPELIATSESLLVTILSGIVSLPVRQPELFDPSADMEELSALGQTALRSAIYATAGSIKDLFESSVSLGQFAADASAVLARASGLNVDIQQYVQQVLLATKRSGIVVPIDDIDLIPGRLSRLLFDVRTIAQYAGVHPVICLSWDDLRANLRAEMQSQFPSFAARDLDRLVDQQVMKTLRPDRVFEPLQLPRNERFTFTPMGEAEALGDLLASTLDALGGEGEERLGTWLRETMTSGRSAAIALGWLPSTFRGLEHLYYEAKGLRKALAQDRRGLEVAHHLRSFVDSITRNHPGASLALDVQSIDYANSRPTIAATVEWPDYRLGVSASSTWQRVFQEPRTRIFLRETHSLGGTTVAGDPNNADETSGDRRAVGANEVSAALVSQSILSSSLFDSPRPAGPLSLLDGSCEFLQSVRIVGLPTNDKVLLLPASAGVIHVDRWFKAWNWMVKHSAGTKPAGAPLELALSQLCRSVNRIWYYGESPDDVSPEDSLLAAVEDVADIYVQLSGALTDDADWTISPEKAFCEWFEFLLPQSFHSALLSEGDLGACLEIWQAALSTGLSGDQGIERLRSFFEGRLESGSRQVKSPIRERVWLYGYKALVRSLSADLLIDLNEFEKEYLERSGRASRGKEAVESTITLSDAATSYRFAPRSTAEGRAQEADIRRLLDQLRQL